MFFSHLLYGSVFAIAAKTQSSSSGSVVGLTASSTGLSEAATPTGSYLSYDSVITVTFSATSGNSVIGTGNSATRTSLSSSSQLLLQGSSRTTTTSATNGSTAKKYTATSTSSPIPTNNTPCNNYPEFCSRKYSNITEVSAHNSPFVKAGNAAANQEWNVITQLNNGIRLLQGQIHFVNGTPHFCHTSCNILDAGPITDYLGTVYRWVSTHPYDVVTILLGNGDYTPVASYVSFIESTGLVHTHTYPPTSLWRWMTGQP
jgi:hypothetical protein